MVAPDEGVRIRRFADLTIAGLKVVNGRNANGSARPLGVESRSWRAPGVRTAVTGFAKAEADR
jgi:hypothetical protein